MGIISQDFRPKEMLTYHYNMGRYFGFPDCCIKAFLNNEHDKQSSPFLGTGYITCRVCSSKPKAEVEKEIQKRRIHWEPFPNSGGLTDDQRKVFRTLKLVR